MGLFQGRLETPHFLTTIRIFGKNLHNCLFDLGSSANVMPLAICKALGITPTPLRRKVTQLDKTEINILGEMNQILIQIVVDLRIQVIDIQVADIPDAYGIILGR